MIEMVQVGQGVEVGCMNCLLFKSLLLYTAVNLALVDLYLLPPIVTLGALQAVIRSHLSLAASLSTSMRAS